MRDLPAVILPPLPDAGAGAVAATAPLRYG